MSWMSCQSKEVVLSEDGGKIVLWFALYRGRQTLEFLETDWVVDTLFEKVKLWLANSD